MNDLHKPTYLDAKMELGTDVQFFTYSLSDLCLYTSLLAVLTILLMILIPNHWTEVFCAYIGSFVTLVVSYIKFGTN